MSSRSFSDFPRNEPGLVDNFIGTAYDVVKRVSDNIPELQRLDGVLGEITGIVDTVVESAASAEASANQSESFSLESKDYRDASEASSLAANVSKLAAAVSEANANQYKNDAEIYAAAALVSKNQAAQSAQDSVAATARFLQPSATVPTTRDDGTPLIQGDRYLSTADYMEYILKNGAWVPNNISGQLIGSEDGTDYIGMPGGITLNRYLRDRDIYVTPEMFGYAVGNSLAVNTQAVQNTFNAANSTKKPVFLSKIYAVSQIYLDTHGEYAIYGSGAITGASTTPLDYVLGFRNCFGIKSLSSIAIAGDGTTNYGSCVKIWASGSVTDEDDNVHLLGSSLINLDFRVVGAPVGWSFGDAAWPDNLLSEIVIRDAYSYNTPIPAQLVGSQCVIEFASYQLVSNGVGALASALHAAAWTYGAHLKLTGGELMKAAVSTGFGLVSSPISSNLYDDAYGVIDVNGTSFECASSLFLAYNPNGIISKPGSGGLTMSQCRGFNNTAESPLQGSPDFSGKVVIEGNCQFHRAADTSVAIAEFVGAATLEIHPDAFDSHWRQGINGITGGVLRFPHQQILEVSNLNGLLVTSGAGTLLNFQSIAAGGLNNRFYSAWNTSTGKFTVPTGGLKGVTLYLNMDTLLARPNSQVELVIDGAISKGTFQFAGHFVQQTWFVGDLAGNQTIEIRFINFDSTFNFAVSNYDKLVFVAHN